ncbi:MADS box transcription factor [Abeliophyllum distichum]|uniref:MADS box transcription factor n=1 Tax=Abeliophyllum distichum TaxID=126358 RepID=A0ABD1PB27_9LAMI
MNVNFLFPRFSSGCKKQVASYGFLLNQIKEPILTTNSWQSTNHIPKIQISHPKSNIHALEIQLIQIIIREFNNTDLTSVYFLAVETQFPSGLEMGRAKLNMELIGKEKSRNITFKKRKEGLMRKMHEFTTLCDVSACMIIYPPKQDKNTVEPEIWPQSIEEL